MALGGLEQHGRYVGKESEQSSGTDALPTTHVFFVALVVIPISGVVLNDDWC